MSTALNGSSAPSPILLQSELMPGEFFLWSGQPSRKVVFHQSDWFAIPFSFLWGGFAIFWEYGATGHFDKVHSTQNTSAISFLGVWGIPFILIGQYLIWGRFLYTAWRKTRTFYGVTNKRVLVLGTGISRKLSDGYLKNLSSVTLTTRNDGLGTIEFTPEMEGQSIWGIYGSRRRGGFPIDIDLARLAFFDVEDAKSVYRLIQEQRESSHA